MSERRQFQFEYPLESGLGHLVGFSGDVADDAAAGPVERLARQSPAMAPRDELVFLLHTAAEIEHALLVQYLFLAYSLPQQLPQRRWSRTLLQIAREEMGHLLAVQNMLVALGAPTNFDREDWPFRQFYPFTFSLAPFSIRSIAKFVLAEMPRPDRIPAELGFDPDQVLHDAGVAPDLAAVTRIGALFELIIELAAELAPDAILPGSESFQAEPALWRAPVHSLVMRIVNRQADLVPLLREISAQGEGSATAMPGMPSHFERLHNLYLEAKAHAQANGHQGLAIQVADNPSVLNRAASGFIRDPTAFLWGDVFNHRYRWLLAIIEHSLIVGDHPHRGDLVRWAFQEMQAALSPIARLLTTLPLSDDGGPLRAGPPFELPYSLRLPFRSDDRWRYHRLMATQATLQLGVVPAGDPHRDLAEELLALDADRLTIIASIVP